MFVLVTSDLRAAIFFMRVKFVNKNLFTTVNIYGRLYPMILRVIQISICILAVAGEIGMAAGSSAYVVPLENKDKTVSLWLESSLKRIYPSTLPGSTNLQLPAPGPVVRPAPGRPTNRGLDRA